ncbi:MAG: Bro-N domain-containing protein [Chitinophagaceae bacterium]|nr:Bro-N domain-containing protein [Chitinophagaceae bacterium]
MSNIKLFESKQIRSAWNEAEQKWYFSIQDVVQLLTDTSDVKDYIKKMKKRDSQLNSNWGTICPLVEMVAADGKKRKVQAANTHGLLRIIQSIPSPKAEPFKLWLAQVGSERLEEIENPEIASQRIREIYKAKGYSDEWIEKRMRGIAVRDELTGEWKKRGVKEGMEYSILTAEISKATFGIVPSDYKKLKGLTKTSENLRDHMTDLELIFTMLGEASTTEIAKNKNVQGFIDNRKVAIAGGKVAGKARKDLERKSGKKVVSKENFKQLPEKEKRKLKEKNS